MKNRKLFLLGICPTKLRNILIKTINQSDLTTFKYNLNQSFDHGELCLSIDYDDTNLQHQQLINHLIITLKTFIISETFNLPETIIDILKRQNKVLSVAESCTGGMISSKITQISGASEVFDTGIVTYSNQSKKKFLGLKDKILIEHGAVSDQTAEAMVRGLLDRTKSNYALSVTGIAGPTGGTIEKPNGTVYIAWGDQNDIKSRRFLIPLTRNDFQNKVTFTALNQLRNFILKNNFIENYYFDKLSDNYSL